VQFVPNVQLSVTVPAVIMLDVSAVPGLLVFILTTRSTGSVDELWPKQGKQSIERAQSNEDIIKTNARFRITCMSLPSYVGPVRLMGSVSHWRELLTAQQTGTSQTITNLIAHSQTKSSKNWVPQKNHPLG
jgi:hypothetical protein